MRRVALLLLGVGALGCDEPAPASPARAPLELRVGCALAWVDGERICEGGAILFVPHGEPPAVELEGAPRDPSWRRLRAGWRADVEAPGRWVLRRGGVEERLRLRPAPTELEAARAARAEGRRDEARARLAAHLGGAEGIAARSLAARLDLDEGAVSRGLAGLERARADHADRGALDRAVRDAVAASWALRTRWRFAEARRALDEAEALVGESPGHPQGAARLLYHRALLQRDVGDLRAALRLFRRAERAAEEVGPDALAGWARQARARVLHGLGRFAEARALLDATDAEGPCERAHLAANRGWLSLLEAEAGGEVDEEALREAVTLYAGPCSHAELANARLNLALARLRAGAEAEAASILDAVADPRAEVAAWRAILAARLARRGGEVEDAVRALDEAGRRFASAPPPLRWRLALELGEARAARGDAEGARRAWRRAEALLDEEARRRPLEGGALGFAGYRGRSAERLVGALVEAGKPREALRVARRAGARGLEALRWSGRIAGLEGARRRAWEASLGRYLEERADAAADAAQDWQRPASELEARDAGREARERALSGLLEDAYAALEPANERLGERAGERPGQRSGAREPAPGEALVVPFASWVFVATADQVAAVPIADPERPLADVGAHLADASLVRLVSGPRWRARPLHVDPVLRDLPVVHGVDLGAPARPRAAGEAVVIADPRGDLVAAALEGEQAAAHLGAPLLRGEAASWDAVSRAFRSSDLFYYAGHGRADDDPLRSGLPLAGGARLEAGDVLAFGEAPRVAVLSGCETARGASPSGRLSLAEALVAAGAERVIGTTERVPDASAARFAAALLEADAIEPAPFTPRELHVALSQLREAGDASWSRYRMLVP